ncbi:MAG: DUF2892 domain-containing protein [Nitrospirota bacterium]
MLEECGKFLKGYNLDATAINQAFDRKGWVKSWCGVHEENSRRCDMLERWLRGIAGVVVLVSLILAQVHSVNWLILTAIMGLNLLQSAFTNW